MVGTRNRRTLGIALLAAVTGLGLLAKPPVGTAQSSRGDDGARLLKGALDLHFHMDPASVGTLLRQHNPAALNLIDPNPHQHSAMRTVD